MVRMVVLSLAGTVAIALHGSALAQLQKMPGPPKTAIETETQVASESAAKLPPPPGGTSTIFGGSIRKVDPVLDQLQLDVYGERPMKILYDERTQVFLNGNKVPLRELKPTDHASVQTTLDGAKIFAVSIHILSKIPQGQYRGRVLRFDRGSGELSLDASPSPQPFRVLVPGTAKIQRTGQTAFASVGTGFEDLKQGSLVEVSFGAEGGKEGVASQVTVLAVPGSAFVFTGNIIALDMGAGFLTVQDPRDQNSYRIAFEPRIIPNGQQLRNGQRIRITASYDGTNYKASDITAY